MTTEPLSVPNQFGISFVPDEKVPPPPRARNVDTERWATAKLLLEEHPNTWACVKDDYDSAQGAQSKSSQINGGNTKDFPASEGWEARHEVTRKPGANGENDKGASKLFLRYTGEKKTKTDES